MIRFLMGFALLFSLTFPVESRVSPLRPVRLDHPRDTMKSFMQAMNDYKNGIETGDDQLVHRIDDAVRTLDISGLTPVSQTEEARAAAIFLKEVIDRVIVINYELIPDTSNTKFWRLKDTEVEIRKILSGDREDHYLFSKDTVRRAQSWYRRVKHLPYLEGSGQGAAYRETPFIKSIPDWAREVVIFLPNWQWLGIFIFIFLGLAMRMVSAWALSVASNWTRKSKLSFGYILEKNIEVSLSWVLASLVWYLGLYALHIEGIALVILKFIVQVFLYGSLIWVSYKIADAISAYMKYWASLTENTFDDQLVPLLAKSLRVFVVVFGILIALQNFGVNVMSLLAGLGLGGLAFALAAKDTAANLFGSIMILMDRPFKVGDWIILPQAEGTVMEIGFRSTRIMTFYNSEVSIPNNIVANADIDNMGRREFRRVRATLGLTYDTPAEKIEAFCEGIKNIIQNNEYTRKDYMHVVFNEYGNFSLNIMVYFFLVVDSWADELIEKQNIYLEILRLAEELKVEFAFPTQTLHLASDPEHPFSHPSYSTDQIQQSAAAFGKGGTLAKPEGMGIFRPAHKDQ